MSSYGAPGARQLTTAALAVNVWRVSQAGGDGAAVRGRGGVHGAVRALRALAARRAAGARRPARACARRARHRHAQVTRPYRDSGMIWLHDLIQRSLLF